MSDSIPATGTLSPGEELSCLQPGLLALARRMTCNEAASADILQRTFLKVLTHVDQYEGRAAFRTWVWRIAVNEALQWRREGMRREREQAVVAACAPSHDVADSPLGALERKRTIARVRAAVRALPPRDRALIEDTLAADSFAVAGLSAHADVCPRTLRTRLCRARKKLRLLLEETG